MKTRMLVTVTDHQLVARDVVRLQLTRTGAELLPPFAPGAHVEVQWGGFTRRYSLTAHKDSGCSYEIMVRRTRPSRGGSDYAHDILRIGDQIEISPPRNEFGLNYNGARHIFIAGGIGITPFISMALECEKKGLVFDLHYMVRAEKDRIALPVSAGSLHHYETSGGRPPLTTLLARADNAAIYVCGPRNLIEEVKREASRLQIAPSRVLWESFGALQENTDAAATIRLAQSGLVIDLIPGTSILEQLRAANIFMPSACERGECGSCATSYLDGSPQHRDLCLTPEQRKTLICPCVSWVKSNDLTLDI
jgi:ferredoxin-NADP reductase